MQIIITQDIAILFQLHTFNIRLIGACRTSREATLLVYLQFKWRSTVNGNQSFALQAANSSFYRVDFALTGLLHPENETRSHDKIKCFFVFFLWVKHVLMCRFTLHVNYICYEGVVGWCDGAG